MPINIKMSQKIQGAAIVGYLITYDPTTAHVKMQKDPPTVVTSIIYNILVWSEKVGCIGYFSIA